MICYLKPLSNNEYAFLFCTSIRMETISIKVKKKNMFLLIEKKKKIIKGKYEKKFK